MPEQPCPHCRGSGIVRERRELVVSVPAGVQSGGRIVLHSEGDQMPGAEPGDVVVGVVRGPPSMRVLA